MSFIIHVHLSINLKVFTIVLNQTSWLLNMKMPFQIQNSDIRSSWTPHLPWMHQMYSYTWSISLWKKSRNWTMPIHWVNEKVPTSKLVGKTETHSCHKSHLWHSAIQMGENSQTPASPWAVKGLDAASSTPTCKTPTWRMGPQNNYYESQWDLHPWDPQDYRKQRNSF